MFASAQRILAGTAGWWLLSATTPAIAQHHPAPAAGHPASPQSMHVTTTPAAKDARDSAGVEHAMNALFDKPEAPLKVAPISIEGVHAVAGWIQGDRGGRALLRKEAGRWSIEVCGGDGLRSADVLAIAGIDRSTAIRLAAKVADAEKTLPADDVRKFALFEGLLDVKGDVKHGHGGQTGHGGPAHHGAPAGHAGPAAHGPAGQGNAHAK